MAVRLRTLLSPVRRTLSHWTRPLNLFALRRDIDTLYELLYQAAHDLDHSIDLSSAQTEQAFASQWTNLEQGRYLLSDPWFRDNVDRILVEEELQLRREWFAGRDVLDAGCGNGRWSFGFARLGANVTAVDVNAVAIEKTRAALEPFSVSKEFHVSPLEHLDDVLPAEKTYDLVFSWGVVHHARSFHRSLEQLVRRVKANGVLYLYLYGRDSVPYRHDLEVFKERLRYHTLPTAEDKYRFLLAKAHGDRNQVHNLHDIYAPLINRRLEYPHVERLLRDYGFADVTRTIDHSELFIRALRGAVDEYRDRWILPRKTPPFWFQHHAA